jgi:RsiW-degrading membrane proteinase PrsW (M82 family)
MSWGDAEKHRNIVRLAIAVASIGVVLWAFSHYIRHGNEPPWWLAALVGMVVIAAADAVLGKGPVGRAIATINDSSIPVRLDESEDLERTRR